MPDIFAPIRVGTPWDTEPPAPRPDAIRGHMEIGREVIWRLGAHMLPTQSYLLLRIRHLTPGGLPLTNHTSTLLAAIRIDFKQVLFNSFFMLSRSSDFRLESFNAFIKLKDAQSENKNKLY